MKPERKTRILAICNIVLLLLLIAVCLHEGYAQRVYKRLFDPEKPFVYTDNPHFQEALDFDSLYCSSHPSVVMIGDSFIQKIEWNELLGRCDVASRGVHGDQTDGILARVPYAIVMRPKIVFLEGGTNDLGRGDSVGWIANNIERAAKQLQDAGIHPVIVALIRVTAAFHESDKVNGKTDSLNRILAEFASTRNIDFLDLNPSLAPNGYLNPEYARADGCHLTAKAYQVWRDSIQHLLSVRGI